MKPAGGTVLWAGMVLCCLPGVRAQISPTRPAQAVLSENTGADAHYVGSRVCGACHAPIFSTYTKTGMGRSVVPGDNKAVLERLPVPFSMLDERTQQYFEVFRKEGKLYQSQYA